MVAAGRNAAVLESLRELGADGTVRLDQDHGSLVSSIRGECSSEGFDVVLDYLWGEPAEAAIEAFSQKGLPGVPRRIQFIQIGESAGSRLSLPAAALRSSAVELLGSGFGSASLKEIFESLARFLRLAPSLKINLEVVRLQDVEALWNAKREARLVFVP